MSKVFTHDAWEHDLLQGRKALELVKSLHRLYCLLRGVLIQSTHIVSPEGLIENRYTYKQQQEYLCFDGNFDSDNDDDNEIPTTTPTSTVVDLLLILINQVPATIPPPPSLLSPFNFSYINVTTPRTTTDSFTDSDTVTPSSSALAITTIPCYDSGTAILSTSSLERITSYSLLSPHVLIPSQFIILLYGEDIIVQFQYWNRGLVSRRYQLRAL